MLSVAIALEPPSESAGARAITQSCEGAIGEGRCHNAAELGPATVVAWYALVRAGDPSVSELKIEFHDRNLGGVVLERRAISFSERDPPETRWASAGAVIAAFVAAREGNGVAPVPPQPPPLPPPLALPAHEAWAWNVDLALFTGPGLDRGAYRLGGLGRFYVAPPQAPRVLGLASLRYAERPGDLALTWWSVSAGLGVRVGGSTTPLSAELTGELSFERLLMTNNDPLMDGPDEAAQNRLGVRLSVNVALELLNHLAWVGGAEATALRPSVAISVGDDAAGRVPAVTYAFSTGLRFSVGGSEARESRE